MRNCVDFIVSCINEGEKYRKERGWENTTAAQRMFILEKFGAFGGGFAPKDPEVMRELEALRAEEIAA